MVFLRDVRRTTKQDEDHDSTGVDTRPSSPAKPVPALETTEIAQW